MKNKNIYKIILITLLILAILTGGFLLYTSDYYHADVESIEEFIDDYDVSRAELYDGAFLYGSKDAEVGFIFYPGGKVEFTAYEPLMYELSSNGITCILLEMPFNLAVLDVNASDKVIDLLPDIKNWYIGGHSLGGSIAATYLEKNSDLFAGLVLLGSYSTSDLAITNKKVLSIYGSEDKVLNKEKYDKYKVNLPSDFKEIIIEGGCHAYFGMYGMQDKDGNPTIKVEDQITLTANYINDFIKS